MSLARNDSLLYSWPMYKGFCASSWNYGNITQATSEGSGEPAHPRSLARASAVRTHEIWKWTKIPTKNQISSLTWWLHMPVWRMSLRKTSAIISWDGPLIKKAQSRGSGERARPCNLFRTLICTTTQTLLSLRWYGTVAFFTEKIDIWIVTYARLKDYK